MKIQKQAKWKEYIGRVNNEKLFNHASKYKQLEAVWTGKTKMPNPCSEDDVMINSMKWRNTCRAGESVNIKNTTSKQEFLKTGYSIIEKNLHFISSKKAVLNICY